MDKTLTLVKRLDLVEGTEVSLANLNSEKLYDLRVVRTGVKIDWHDLTREQIERVLNKINGANYVCLSQDRVLGIL